jgi:hypothetical protein
MVARNVTKSLAVAEDLLHGAGTVVQTRNGVPVTGHRIDIPIGINSEAELFELDPLKFPRARFGNTEFEYIAGEWRARLVLAPYLLVPGLTMDAKYNQVTKDGVIARYVGTLPYTTTGVENISAFPWEVIGGSGGGSGGGGVIYDIPPSAIAIGATYFDPETFELAFSYQDSSSVQYLTFPLFGVSVNSDGGGASDVVLDNTAGSGSTLLNVLGGGAYQVKRLVQGTNISFSIDGNSITINSTAGGGGTTTLTNDGSTGTGLVNTLVGSNYPIKRLFPGTNMGIVDNGTHLTLNASGGVSDGDKGDVVVASTGASWTLKTTGVTAGTYNNSSTQVRPFTVDAKGRITSIGSPVDIAVAFSAVSGKPSTLAGYGITNGQPLDSTLTALASLTTAANQMIYSTGADAFAMTGLTALARNLIASATTSNMLNQLGIIVTTNANGTSVRIPTASPTSGIQICFNTNMTLPATDIASGSGFTSNALVWTFPQAFSVTPAYSFSNQNDDNVFISGAGCSATVAAARGKAFISVPATVVVATAIGVYNG